MMRPRQLVVHHTAYYELWLDTGASGMNFFLALQLQ